MATVRRLTDSCVVLTSGGGSTLIDPGFHTFESGEVELSSIGDIQQVLITHQHIDHVSPDFVRWLLDRSSDLTVHANSAVASLLAPYNVEVDTDNPPQVTSEDVLHGTLPFGAPPPNRSFTVEGILTHPGDSQEPTSVAHVLALPLMAPWTSTTAALNFAIGLKPERVIPIHDFYTSRSGRQFLFNIAQRVLGQSGIEFIPLDWGESAEL